MDKHIVSTIMIVMLVLISMLGISTIAFAQESGQTETGAGTVGPPVKTKFLGPADQKFIDPAESYIKQKLGEDYYNQFISFQSGSSHEDCIENECAVRNEISFNYKIPFEIVGDPHLSGPLRIQITLDTAEKVINYVGPSKPYRFLISKGEAINKAESYGLIEITSAGIASSSGTPDGYEIVWAVSSNDLVGECRDIGGMRECIYKGAYVDVDIGEIRGEYRINPLILTPSGTGGVKLGEFFERQGTKKEQEQKEQDVQKLTNIGISAFIIIVVLIAIFFIWYRFYRSDAEINPENPRE